MDERRSRLAQQRSYWRRALGLTLVLLFVWFTVTFVVSCFSDWLNQWAFLGLPLGYFISARGVLLVYLLLIAFYAIWMNHLDRQYGVEEQ